MAVYDLNGNPLSHIYDLNGVELNYAYDMNGVLVYTKGKIAVDYNNYSLDVRNYCTIEMVNLQGFDIHDGVIFQLRSNPAGTITTIDKATQSVITQDIEAGTGHGNSAMFSSEYYDPSDEYPLLWATAPSNSIVINRVTESTSQTIYTYSLDSTKTGYLSGFGLDEENELLYVVGYTMNDWYSDNAGANKVILSKWDISNGTPTFVTSVERDFIYCMQGCTFHDGMLWVASGTNQMDQYVYALNPNNGVIKYSVNTTLRREIEGCTFISDTELVVGLQGGTYRKINFAEKSYRGKTLSILGDSISTYLNWIPSGNRNFYTGENCGVTSVNQTWWKRAIDRFGMTLSLNNSWSGSRVTTSAGESSAGCGTRSSDLGTSPDVIIVYMGVNDFNNEIGLGTYDGTGDIPTATTTFREAYGVMLNNIKTAYPNAEIFCATLTIEENNGNVGDPEINDAGVPLTTFNDAIKQIAEAFNAKVIDLYNCGITYATLPTYMGDYSTETGKALHPNADGHALIAQKAMEDMMKG